MKWIRFIVAIVIGYILSQSINMLLVLLFYGGGSGNSVPAFGGSAVGLAIGGLLTGIVVRLIAGPLFWPSACAAAGIVFIVTLLNIYLHVAIEPLSYKLTVLVVLVSSILIGSRLEPLKRKTSENG
ncbi:MAG: hypothetical protein HKN33_05710 [Pyrinomonadaceae bacterium]|nr:hypothetical protein [Pyrinomonadaceae bacterium]